MGKRQDYLKEICQERFDEGSHIKPSKSELLDSKYYNIIETVYRNLNGQQSIPPTRFGPWDIEMKDFIIELDEERHFNRYRETTLKSELYLNWKSFDIEKYRLFCTKFEQKCLSAAGWSGNWKNNSTEKQFEKSNTEKELAGNGSSRWKQRAYYDFVKDVSSQIMGVPIIRISIYDTIDSLTINELLNNHRKEILLNYIENRISKTKYYE